MKTQRGNTGVGFLCLLAVLFIGLKLTGGIAWSWWVVLLPLYGGFALFLIIAVIALILIAAHRGEAARRRRH